jgi:diacylglycerol kinase
MGNKQHNNKNIFILKGMKRLPLFSAFRHASNGILWFFKVERNAKIHFVCTILVVAVGFILHATQLEWLFLTFAIISVWVAELLNSAIELLCDYVQPERNSTIKIVKDLAAGAVLFAAIGSAIVGGVVFLPKIYLILQGV